MDAARPEPPLRDLETAALAEQDVAHRHAHVLVHDLAMAVRRVVEAEHRQHALDRDAGHIPRHQDHRLLLVAVGIVRGGLAHEDDDLAARVADARRPPLAAVDHVVVAVALDRRLDVGGVRRRDIGLRHGEARADFPLQQRRQPLLLLGLGAVELERLHVAGVGRRAVEHLGRPVDAPHDLAQMRVVEVRQPGAALGVREEQVPQPGGARLGLQGLDDRHRLPAVGGAVELVPVDLLVGVDLGIHERLQALRQPFDLVARIEAHRLLPLVRAATLIRPEPAVDRHA